MSKIEYGWSSSLDVGNEKLNDDHRDLLRRMAQLEELNTKSLDKTALRRSYLSLVEFAQQHFREEEEHMKAIGYPELEAHQRIHQSMLDALLRYYREFETSVYGRFPSSVFDFFKTWMTTHIMIVDRRYGEYELHRLASDAKPAR